MSAIFKQEEFVNNLKVDGTTVTKNTAACDGIEILQSPATEATQRVQSHLYLRFPNEHRND